jgi:hypothetical protein
VSVSAPDRREPKTRAVSWLETQRSWNTLLIIGVVLLAAVIRFWNLGSLGYQHWDEYFFIRSAYVVSGAWPKGLRTISYVITPLVPYTDGTFFHFLGVNRWIPFAVSATYGTLSALALYFLGSRLFGKGVGLIAAAVLATAEFSVTFSRMALADATFEFWVIASVLCVWLGFTRRRFWYWVLAGVSTGLLLNTKYIGVFPLILAVTWVIVEFIVDLVAGRRQFVSKAWSAYLPRVIGVATMIAVAVLFFSPWLVKLSHNPTFQAFLGHETSFSSHKTTPDFIVWYYWLWTSPPTVVLAVLGIAVALVRFTRADRLMLIYTAGWFAALMTFDPYPREALSLLPAVGIWAGRAIVEAWRLLAASKPRLQIAATPVAVACCLAILIGQILPLPHMLSLRTKGYADAGAIAARYQSTGNTIFVRTQDAAYLYLKGEYILRASPLVVQLLNEKGSKVVFMTDQTVGWFADATAFFDLNRDRLDVVARVPNPLYPEVFLQPATADKLSHLDDPPDAYRYITFWQVTGPLLYPANWPT